MAGSRASSSTDNVCRLPKPGIASHAGFGQPACTGKPRTDYLAMSVSIESIALDPRDPNYDEETVSRLVPENAITNEMVRSAAKRVAAILHVSLDSFLSEAADTATKLSLAQLRAVVIALRRSGTTVAQALADAHVSGEVVGNLLEEIPANLLENIGFDIALHYLIPDLVDLSLGTQIAISVGSAATEVFLVDVFGVSATAAMLPGWTALALLWPQQLANSDFPPYPYLMILNGKRAIGFEGAAEGIQRAISQNDRNQAAYLYGEIRSFYASLPDNGDSGQRAKAYANQLDEFYREVWNYFGASAP